ncbi:MULTISPECIES: hypothetical protein [Bacteroidales]|uniref:hypothetical protein n=1 Tax=Bacteroidales TaxID=171549 RepID=UPI002AC33F76|nr:hypothetical protein [Alistipes putredinis]
MIHRIPAACIAALLLIACGGPPKPADGLADANLAALELTVDMENRPFACRDGEIEWY